MENATKAILMVAGVLFALLIISILIINYNNLKDFFEAKDKDAYIKSIEKFNKEYELYNSERVKGYDLLSLVKKVVDYNEREADPATSDKLYAEMNLSISIPDRTNFYYLRNRAGIQSTFDQHEIIQESYNKNNFRKGSKHILADAVNGTNGILSRLPLNLRKIIDEKDLQELVKNISNIFECYNNDNQYNQAKRTETYKKVGLQYSDLNPNEIKAVEIAALEYYQITYFKRSIYRCTNVEYDDSVGRIIQMDFEFVRFE